MLGVNKSSNCDDFVFPMKAPSQISITKHSDMAVPQTIYEALPLNTNRREIRLSQFHEYVYHSVRVSMIKASLDDPDLSYHALSYCWGEPVFDQAITCNAEDVKITAGLFAVLRRLQHFLDCKLDASTRLLVRHYG